MTAQSSLIDIDQNLFIFRVLHGIKLVKPKLVAQEMQTENSFSTGHTIASLSSLPFNFYFLNADGATLHMNQQCVEICGFQSINDSIGKSLFDVSNQESAAKLINNCNSVISENKIKIFEEENIRKDGASLQFLSVK